MNTFYVSQYLNIQDGDGYAYIAEFEKDCNGKNKGFSPNVRIYKHAATNCFYTTYQYAKGADNDRINEGKKGKK